MEHLLLKDALSSFFMLIKKGCRALVVSHWLWYSFVSTKPACCLDRFKTNNQNTTSERNDGKNCCWVCVSHSQQPTEARRKDRRCPLRCLKPARERGRAIRGAQVAQSLTLLCLTCVSGSPDWHPTPTLQPRVVSPPSPVLLIIKLSGNVRFARLC